MYQAVKVHQVARETYRLKVAILAVSEDRRFRRGKMYLVTRETLLYSDATDDNAPYEKGGF